MSRENVQTLRAGFVWFQLKGTFPAHLATPDFIWDMSHYHGWPEQQVYQGAQGAERFFAEWGAAWDGWEVEIEELHDAGDKVVAIVNQRGRSKIGGMLVEGSMGQVWAFRDGKEARMGMYSDPREALAAVGLSERATP
jgi:ketosteroid isomerase-like protein